jgi:orotate phosphoribosyltransferase
MSDLSATAFLKQVEGRRGHFKMESGYHSDLWLDLDALFARPKPIELFVDALVNVLRPHRVDAVCGPLLGGALLAQWVAREVGVEFAFTEKVNVENAGLFTAQYRLPPALAKRLRGRRVAMVDDVMSAGSSLRATHAALVEAGAVPVVAGALLVLGDAGVQHFAQIGIPVEAPARESFAMWPPDTCPLCAAGMPLEQVASS